MYIGQILFTGMQKHEDPKLKTNSHNGSGGVAQFAQSHVIMPSISRMWGGLFIINLDSFSGANKWPPSHFYYSWSVCIVIIKLHYTGDSFLEV